MNKNAERIKQQYLETAKYILQLITEKGDSLQFQKLVNSVSSPYNPISKVYYKGANRWVLCFAQYKLQLTGCECPNLWVTEKQAARKGWHLKKDATPFFLGKYIPLDKRDKESENEDFFRMIRVHFTVYNLSDFDGVPVGLLQPEELQYDSTDEGLIRKVQMISPCTVRTSWSDTPSYNPISDHINMPELKKCSSISNYCLSLLHEIVHSTGHSSRLNRKLGTQFGSLDYAKEELVAELGSLLLAQRLHLNLLECDYDSSAAYLKSWCQPLEDDYMQVIKALKASETAINFLLHEEVVDYDKCS